MTNKETLKGLVIGYMYIYDDKIDKLSKAQLKRYIEEVDLNSDCDVCVYYRGKPYIIEHVVVDHEHDFYMQSFEDYALQYGDYIEDYMYKFDIPKSKLTPMLKEMLEDEA